MADCDAQKVVEAIAEFVREHGYVARTTKFRKNLPWEVQIIKPGVMRYRPRRNGRRLEKDLIISVEADSPHLAEICTESQNEFDSHMIDLANPDSLDEILGICNAYLVDTLLDDLGGDQAPGQ